MMRLRALESGHDRPTRATFAALRAIGRCDVPEILKLACYRHRYFGTPFHALVQHAMRGPSAWTVGEREVIAVVTSQRNSCPFCATAHHAIAGAYRTDADDASGRSPALAATLRFLDTLDPVDAQAAREAGVSDEALLQATEIAALFDLINRAMNAVGAQAITGRAQAVTATVVRRGGYRIPPPVRYLSRSV
jgi:AhpD family alkylhydroperoxidase